MRETTGRLWLQSVLLGGLALGPISCGCTGDDFGGTGGSTIPVVAPLLVASIQPNPFIGFRGTPFVLTGSGFLRTVAPKPGVPGGTSANAPSGGSTAGTITATVTFIANEGTPFADGTSAEAQVVGTVISNTVIQGIAPVTNQRGEWTAGVRVTDALGSGQSPKPIALFIGLAVFEITPSEIPSDQAMPFLVDGLAFLPLGGQATVRFTAPTPVFPGPSATMDVLVDILSPIRVGGTTTGFPLAVPVDAFVTVILHQEPGLPEATSSAAIARFVPPPPVPVVVTAISPPMPIEVSTPFTVTGSGFGGGNASVAVTFTAATRFFQRGTAVTMTVVGTAVDDNTVVGLSPTGSSTTDIPAFVTITRSDGEAGTSASAIALFVAPAVSPPSVDAFTPHVLHSDVSAAFQIIGANLPTGEVATVRFRALSGTPFSGGGSATVDVAANVTTATQIDGMSPLAVTAAPFLCEVDVILASGAEFFLGVQVLFLAPSPPQPPVGCVVTNLDNDGPGSLRDRIANAPLDCIITFDPSLSGNLDITSTLLVEHNVHILGPGPDVISIRAVDDGNAVDDDPVADDEGDPDDGNEARQAPGSADSDGDGDDDDDDDDEEVGDDDDGFPIFTIEPAANNTFIELLEMRESRNDGDGGGIRVRGGLTLIRCEIRDNRIDGDGAGVHVDSGGTLTMRECILRENHSDDRGGGLFVEENATVQVIGCTINDNEGEDGGGGFSCDPHATVSFLNCTFYNNGASGGPGGGGLLVMPNTTVTMVHCTLAENFTHGEGGGVLIQNGDFTATNCIFARNSDSRGSPEIGLKNGTNNTTFSLLRTGAGSGLTNGVAGNRVGTNSNPLDAKLGSLQENGGPTRTMMPKQNSPAINVASAAACSPTDQRLVARPIGAGCDMGACESDFVF